MRHHTKDKGDIGIGYVIADLISKNIHIFLPLSEHLPFDLIGVKNNGQTIRISVKYRKIKNGAITVPFYSSYSDSKKVHTKFIDKSLIDLLAIYCPETKKVYYVQPSKFDKCVSLRIEKSKNKQSKNINFCEDYLSVP